MHKVNQQHLLRLKLYINILDDKAKYYKVEPIDLSHEVKKSAWEEAVKIVNETAYNFNAGIQKRS